MVVVVGVVCRHLLDPGGDAPHRLHVRLRGRPALCPPPFAPSSPLGSIAPSRLSLGARGALALALGPLSSPLPVSRVPPPVPHALARSLSHLPSPCPLHLSSLPAPLRALPVPWPLPGPLPRVAPSAACALLPPAAAPFLDHSPGVPLPLQLRQRDARRRALARRGADVPLPPRGEGLGGERLWGGWCGCGWGWRGRGTSRSPCPLLLLRRPPARRPRPVRGSSPACAACWGPRRGRPRRCRGPPGSRPSRALLALLRCRGGRRRGARGRGRNPSHALLVLLCCRGGRRRGARGPCGVRPPRSRRAGGRGRSPSRALPALLRCRGGRRRGARGPCGRNPSRALLALLCGCGSPRRCARFLRRGCPPCRPRAGGRRRGRGVARCGLRSLRVRAGRGGGAGCLGGGGGRPGWPRLPGWRRRPDQHRRLRQPPLLALREGLPRPLRGGDGGAGAGPAVVAVVPPGGTHRSLPSLLPW